MKLPGLILTGLYYPIAKYDTLQLSSQPSQVWLDGKPLVLYKGPGGYPVVHSDVCPHLGASLAGGYLNKDKGIVCPYHGFVFREGRFCGVLGTGCKRGGKRVLDMLPVYTDRFFVYTAPLGGNANLPFQPPEEYDPDFRAVHGYRDLDIRQAVVTENILDMLHISFVHRFGNPNAPLPRSIRFERLDDQSGRSTFQYMPRPGTLSSLVAGSRKVVVDVENEYHLPSTTITRVTIGGKDVKTVLTRAQALGPNRTRLYYVVYRNFWKNALADLVIGEMMKMTLDEDVAILGSVHQAKHLPEDPLGVLYDVTFMKYREAIQNATAQAVVGGCGSKKTPCDKKECGNHHRRQVWV